MAISFNASTILNGSGIDVTGVVSQIQAQQSGQLTVWQQQQTDLQTQASVLSTINNHLSSLSAAVNSLSDILGPLTQLAGTSSQSSIVTVESVQSSATTGNHTVVVSGLASAGTVYTDALANADTSILPTGVNSATIQLQVGGSSGVTRSIAITRGSNDTLSTLASYINTQSTQNNWGVTASVLNDATGARLAIYSQATGTPGALAITSNDTNLTFEPPVGGANATFTVDGIPFSSTTNTVTDAIPGVTLSLVSAYASLPVQVSIGPDSTQAAQAVTDFVSAYNAVIGDINTQFTVDPTTNSQGPLGSDSSLRTLQSSLLAGATYSVTGNNGLVNLASLGITMNDDGTLSVNSATLSNAMTTNSSAFLNFFQNSSLTGFANNFKSSLQSLTDSTEGVMSLDIAENKTKQQALANEIYDFQNRLASQKQMLINQFSQVNAILQAFPSYLQEIQTLLGYSTSNSSSGSTPQSGSSTS